MGVLISVANSVDNSLLGDGSVTLIPFKPVSVTQGTWAFVQGATFPCCHLFGDTSVTDKDECAFSVMLSQGTYTLQIPTYKQSVSGILKVYLDAVLIATFDQYIAIDAVALSEQTGIVVSAGKRYTLTLKADGKNGASGGNGIYVSSINFIKTA